jgi:hypothetical protein
LRTAWVSRPRPLKSTLRAACMRRTAS